MGRTAEPPSPPGHSAPAGPGPAGGRPWLWAAGILFGLVLLAAGQVIAHWRDDDLDRWLYAYFGERLLAGQAMYADLWDVKPPLIYWMNALGLWMGRGSYAGVVACCAAVSLLALPATYAAARAYCRPGASGLAALLGAIYYTHFLYYGGTNRPETLQMLLELTAAVFYLRHVRRGGAWNILAAGAACGLAAGAKQTGLTFFAAMCLDQLSRLVRPVCRGDAGRPAGSRRGTLAGLAGLPASLLGLSVGASAWLLPTLWRAGAGDAYGALIGFHRLYLQSEGVNLLRPHLGMVADKLRVLALPLVLATAAVLHTLLYFVALHGGASTGGSGERPSDGGQRTVFVLAVWTFLSLYGVALAPHDHRHYWLLILPPLVLLSARTIDLLVGEFSVLEAMRRRMGTAVAGVAAAYLALHPLELQWEKLWWVWYHRAEAWDPPAARKIAETIEVDARPEDAVFVWGYAPHIVRRLHRPYPTRYVGTHFFELKDGLGQPLFDDMCSALRRSPPAYLVMPGGMEALRKRLASQYALDLGEFVGWVAASYGHWKDVAGNSLYRLQRDPA